MSSQSEIPQRLFTVEEANAMLPLVRAIASDIAELAQNLMERRERLQETLAARPALRRDPYSEEILQVQREMEADAARLQKYVEELRELGVEAKGPQGLVDFPSLLDGRVVYLCWKLGESEVCHWHDIHGGFAGRQPLPSGVVTGPKPA